MSPSQYRLRRAERERREAEDPADVAAYLYSREVSEQRARMYASSYRSLLAAQKRT